MSADRGSRSAPLVSVVVPVHRNEPTLRELHARLGAALEQAGVRRQLVFVDDASPDGSRSLLGELALRDPSVQVVPLAQRGGQQRAVMAGLACAEGDAVVVLDADLQDPPEAIPLLLEGLRGGWAAVFAGRRGRYESPGRLASSRVFKRLLGGLCGVPRDAGMFVALSRPLVDRVVALRDRAPYLVAMIGCTGLPSTSVPVARSSAPGRRSSYTSLGRMRVASSALLRIPVWRLRLRVRDA